MQSHSCNRAIISQAYMKLSRVLLDLPKQDFLMTSTTYPMAFNKWFSSIKLSVLEIVMKIGKIQNKTVVVDLTFSALSSSISTTITK